MNEAGKMELTSMDVAGEKRDDLKRCLGEVFPEIFADGSIDFDQLKRLLGEWVDLGKERFGLNWPGKAECMRIIQQPSVATLKPVRDESVNFDETENLFIEGDNLEVLKLLQKAYFGKIKVIYIDPPYNTGKEFSTQGISMPCRRPTLRGFLSTSPIYGLWIDTNILISMGSTPGARAFITPAKKAIDMMCYILKRESRAKNR